MMEVVPLHQLLAAGMEAQNHPERVRARQLPTGYPALDARVVIDPGDLVVIGADTNVGKSKVALCIGEHLARAGRRVLHFHLEDGRQEVERRLLGLLASASPALAARFQLAEGHRRQCQRRIEQLPALPWGHVFGSREVGTICKAVRHFKPDVMVVDYLQALRGEQSARGDLRTAMVLAMDALQDAARDSDAMILCTSQIRRPEGGSETFEPGKHHLKEAGAIEERSDKIFMLWRESWAQGAPTKIKCAKDKAGVGTGWRGELHFDANTGRLFERGAHV